MCSYHDHTCTFVIFALGMFLMCVRNSMIALKAALTWYGAVRCRMFTKSNRSASSFILTKHSRPGPSSILDFILASIDLISRQELLAASSRGPSPAPFACPGACTAPSGEPRPHQPESTDRQIVSHLEQLQSLGTDRELLPFDDVVHVRLHLRHRLDQRQVAASQGEVLLELLIDHEQGGVGQPVGDQELAKVFGAMSLDPLLSVESRLRTVMPTSQESSSKTKRLPSRCLAARAIIIPMARYLRFSCMEKSRTTGPCA